MRAHLIVAANLRRLRVARGVSQEAFAVDAGIDRTYVSRLERGLENPSIAVVEKIAKALKADMRDLLDPQAARTGSGKPLPGGRRPKR